MSMRPKHFPDLFLLPVAGCATAIEPQYQSVATSSTTLAAEVVAVTDGDSLTELVNGELLKIRFKGLDALDLGQPHARNAEQALSDLAFGQEVRIEDRGQDRYGRVIAYLYVNGKLLDLAMLEQGIAWYYDYFNENDRLAAAEIEAGQRISLAVRKTRSSRRRWLGLTWRWT